MFSRYLVTIHIANKDTLTVALALTQLFTKYGVCKTLISDLGSEFSSKCIFNRSLRQHLHMIVLVFVNVCIRLWLRGLHLM